MREQNKNEKVTGSVSIVAPRPGTEELVERDPSASSYNCGSVQALKRDQLEQERTQEGCRYHFDRGRH